MIRVLAVAVALVCASGAHADMASPPQLPRAAAPAKPVVTKLFSGTTTALGQRLVLPQGGIEVTVLNYDIPAGASLPVHKHPHPRYAYVLAGRLEVSTGDNTKSFEYGPGDFIVEMLNEWHYGKTLGTEAVKLLVIDQAPAGETNTILK
jgi:quercetin dioxygenase-like cupin family protein